MGLAEFLKGLVYGLDLVRLEPILQCEVGRDSLGLCFCEPEIGRDVIDKRLVIPLDRPT